MKLIDLFSIIRENEADHEEALNKSGFWGRKGAGGLIYARSTKRFLLGYRSAYVQEPHTWGVFGGAIDAREDPAQAVQREIAEEIGYSGPIDMSPLYLFRDAKSGFTYQNFLVMVPDEFKPRLNWEHAEAEWFPFGKWPKPLHFGVREILRNSQAVSLLKGLVTKTVVDAEAV